MEPKDLETIIKDTKKLLKDDKFIAFSGVDRTTLDKKAFTDALKCHANTVYPKLKFAIQYPGTCVENVYIYTKHAHACLYIPPLGEGKRKSRTIAVTVRMDGGTAVFENPGLSYKMDCGYFQLNGKTQYDFELALLKIRSILVTVDDAYKAIGDLRDTIDNVTDRDPKSPLVKGE